MKKLIAISALIFAAITFSNNANAAEGGEGETGSILDYIGISAGGCGAPAGQSCSEDATAGLFASIACKVMKSFNEGVIPLYCNIVQNPDYLMAIDAAMMLYVVLLGFSFIFGLVPMRAGVVVGKALKAIIIYAIIINADMYFSLVYNSVIQTTQDAVRILLNSNTGAGSGTGSENFFEYVDKAMNQIFNSTFQSESSAASGQTYNKTNLKIFMMGLAIWQLGGDLIGGLFFAVVAGWIMAYFSIMIRYLLAMLSMMFLLMLGPIFIPTLLFEQSKNLGEEWIFMLVCFMMQIVLVIAFVLMVQGFFIDFYKMIEKGIESASTMTQSKEKITVPVNTDPTANEGAYMVSDQANSMGYTPEQAEQYFSNVFAGDYKEELPKMVIKLIKMMVIVMSATAFLAVVPSLAALLVGRARFIRLFAGQNFGAKDDTRQANLFGQDNDLSSGANAATRLRKGGPPPVKGADAATKLTEARGGNP